MPLAGGVCAYAIGNKRAPAVAVSGIFIGFLFALRLIAFDGPLQVRWQWLPGLELGWSIDPIALALICLVYFISLLVHLFSIFYMKGDPGLRRYFFKLGFFTFSMLGLLAADHLILVFIFWELVGFSSYLLIGFWFKDVQKARSAREAFMINRIADAGLLIGVVLMVMVIDQPYLSELTGVAPGYVVHLAGFGLVIGALGKSAQFPFFGWLPKAMAGPTPASALIHAATMVAAGVYLLVRVVPFLSPLVLTFTAFAGALTALMAAYAALTQHDVKKVLAYSTISQLGYMVMGVGVGAYQASLFHLWTHAFFKAGLFLAAGAVIHFMHQAYHDRPEVDTHDMRNMGGLQRQLPITALVFMICGFALSGLPFFSGFLSKEGILSGAWFWASQIAGGGSFLAYLVPDMAFLAALFTPVYIGRQILLIFFGTPASDQEPVANPEPVVTVRVPLIILGFGSLWFFNALNPFNAHGWWLNEYLFSLEIIRESAGSPYIQQTTLFLSILLSVSGLALAYYFFRPGGKRRATYQLATEPVPWHKKLSYHGWFLQEFYDVVSTGFMKITKFAHAIDARVIDPVVHFIGVGTVVFSKFLGIIDREVVDGIVNLAAWFSRQVGVLLSKVQAGRVQTQIAWMVLSVLFIIIWFQLRGE